MSRRAHLLPVSNSARLGMFSWMQMPLLPFWGFFSVLMTSIFLVMKVLLLSAPYREKVELWER